MKKEEVLFREGDQVLILKRDDIFFGFRAKITKRMNIVSLDSLDSKPSNHWKVLIDTTSRPVRSQVHPHMVKVSNIQYKDYHEQELTWFSKISRLLYG